VVSVEFNIQEEPLKKTEHAAGDDVALCAPERTQMECVPMSTVVDPPAIGATAVYKLYFMFLNCFAHAPDWQPQERQGAQYNTSMKTTPSLAACGYMHVPVVVAVT
jgi:hypothetical protein